MTTMKRYLTFFTVMAAVTAPLNCIHQLRYQPADTPCLRANLRAYTSHSSNTDNNQDALVTTSSVGGVGGGPLVQVMEKVQVSVPQVETNNISKHDELPHQAPEVHIPLVEQQQQKQTQVVNVDEQSRHDDQAAIDGEQPQHDQAVQLNNPQSHHLEHLEPRQSDEHSYDKEQRQPQEQQADSQEQAEAKNTQPEEEIHHEEQQLEQPQELQADPQLQAEKESQPIHDASQSPGDATVVVNNKTGNHSGNGAIPDPVEQEELYKPSLPWPGAESTYNWQDVNLTVDGACGWHKCFFPSVSNASVGYLILSDKEYDAMKIADDVARDIYSRFGSKHFHLALDRDVVSPAFKAHINSLVVQPSRAINGLPILPILDDMHQVVIQKVVVAPEPTFFFAVMSNNYKKSLRLLNDFAPKIPDKQAFGETLRAEQARLCQVLDYKPGLVRDLQALIDIHGNVYHIDLDGHVHLQAEPLEEWEVPRAKAGLLQVMTNLTVGGTVSF